MWRFMSEVDDMMLSSFSSFKNVLKSLLLETNKLLLKKLFLIDILPGDCVIDHCKLSLLVCTK